MLVQNCDCSCETAMAGLFDAISAIFLVLAYLRH